VKNTPKTPARTPKSLPREITGTLLEVLNSLQALDKIELMVSGFEHPIALDASIRASAFVYEETPTKYELGHKGVHIGMAYLKGTR
jgi:hypothetical protein